LQTQTRVHIARKYHRGVDIAGSVGLRLTDLLLDLQVDTPVGVNPGQHGQLHPRLAELYFLKNGAVTIHSIGPGALPADYRHLVTHGDGSRLATAHKNARGLENIDLVAAGESIEGNTGISRTTDGGPHQPASTQPTPGGSISK